MGFSAGFCIAGVTANLFMPFQEEKTIFLYTLIFTVIVAIGSLFLRENFIQIEICIVGSFMFVYSLYFVFLKDTTAFDYNILIKIGYQ